MPPFPIFTPQKKSLIFLHNQIKKINGNTNDILDLMMACIRGDNAGIQALENRTRNIKVGKKEEVITLFKVKDPNEIALKAMAEIREQIGLQTTIFKSLYDVQAIQEFRDEVLETLEKYDKGIRNKILEDLKEKRLLHASVQVRP
jgi:hypothetical protein